MTSSYAHQFFGVGLTEIDPLTDALIQLEEERQRRRLILIPSESYVPHAVRQALGSVFTNIYAEGYPPAQMVGRDEDLLADMVQQLAYYRRYADRRFYKGADYVHLIEALAQRRAAECFANERASADDIFCNVQPLSGAAANLAVYDALMKPGDTLMGMNLFIGGHLTHGSEFNVSGKRYKVISYGVRESDGQLDYDEIRRLAETHRPQVIVAGYTSYPWAPDFTRFRAIADSVGAYLMADVAHPAGMVIAGVYPNPIGIAHVVSFTTHKTLCGPRGACIMTTHAELAKKIDQAVFPGLQGGPHTNKFAAMCVAFAIARTPAFHELQRGIVENAQALARGLTDRDLKLAYGGTDTHLLMLDLNSVRHPRHPDHVLYGEVAARILDLAGIVVNKNTIPGDQSTALATGIRMGTPWLTQRGLGPAEMDRLAECIARIVQGIVPFTYPGMAHPLPRGKIDLAVLEKVKGLVEELACAAEVEIDRGGSGYPHFCVPAPAQEPLRPRFAGAAAGHPTAEQAELVDLSDMTLLRVSGWRARPFLEDVCTADMIGLAAGEGTQSLILDGAGRVIDDVLIWRCPSDERGRDRFLLLSNPENAAALAAWLRALSDGYILFDDQDVWRKVRGPAKVETEPAERETMLALHGPPAGELLSRVLPGLPDLPGRWMRPAWYHQDEVAVMHGGWGQADDVYAIAGPAEVLAAMWDELAAAGAVPVGVPAARQAQRQAAGLPPRWPEGPQEREGAACLERLPHLFARRKPYFVGQNKLPQPEATPAPEPFAWAEPDAPLQRTPLYDEHVRLRAKMISFAGWEMPVWYTSVGQEHNAVREAAGLFDVAHMGTLEVSGPYAAEFLDLVTVNYAQWLEDGKSHYSALLDVDGHAIDDIWVYCRAADRYFVVVNAVNFDKDWAWLNAVNDGRVLIDRERPWVRVSHPAVLRNLKDPASGADQRVDLALQGPNARKILLACIEAPAQRKQLRALQRTGFMMGTLGDIDVLISRTGYTGAEVGYELYIHPDRAAALWRLLLEKGAPHGLLPCGLAARDSLRIEAGLPLYGHELDGALQIGLGEAGFGAYIKLHQPFFVGRAPSLAQIRPDTRPSADRASEVVRFGVAERGARALRGGEPVVNRRGRVVGRVTSCALIGEQQIGMALIESRYVDPGSELLIYPETRHAVSKAPEAFAPGDTVALPVRAQVLPRFPWH